MTLIVNLYGGPGTGKSTIAAGVFHQLKCDGVNVELAHEFAKDLTWEKRSKTLQFQPYVIGKQMYRIWRLIDQVDVIITDSPILLGSYYANEDTPWSFHQMLADYQQKWDTLDIVLERDLVHHPYNPAGRNQTQDEAIEVDKAIWRLLDKWNIPYDSIKVSEITVSVVSELVYEKLI